MKEEEASSTMLETAATLEGELKEARAEVKAWKSTLEADKDEPKSAQQEIECHMEALRGTHTIAKGLEKEKFALIRHNDQLERSTRDLQVGVEKLKVELEFEKSKLSNGVLLKETFR